MRRLGTTLLLLLLVTTARAAAPAPTRVDGNHVHVSMPAGWIAQPDAAAAVKKGMLAKADEITGDGLAYGDPRAGVFGILLWIDGKKPITGSTRGQVEGFMKGVHESAIAGERKTDVWQVSETATRYSVKLASSTPTAELAGVSSAVVDQHGLLHGYLMLCVRAGAAREKPKAIEKARAQCDQLLASFELTWRDAELKKLEKK